MELHREKEARIAKETKKTLEEKEMETGYDVMSIEKMGKKERKKLYYIETKQKKRKNRALRQQR